ncbi:MAG: hypothetical protein V1792_16600 [Pseudomonadota bacterium]
MDIKIRMKMGDIEIEYEGPGDYLRKGIADMVAATDALQERGSFRPEMEEEEEEMETAAEEEDEEVSPDSEKQPLPISVSSIAKTLRCTTGQDLVVAACASLMLVKQEDVFSREQIRLEMKEAGRYYKENYRKSLSKYLRALVRSGVLLEVDNNTYSIPAGTLAQLEEMLGS